MEKIDILQREEFVERLVKLTESISANRKNVSFALDGAWGSGKTFVLDMYEEQLRVLGSEETCQDKYFVVHYNCWEYDYYEEPLVALVSAMIEIIDHQTSLWPDSEKKAKILGVLKAVGQKLFVSANARIKEKIGIDVIETVTDIKTGIDAGEAKYEKEHEYDDFSAFKKALKELREQMAEISEDKTIVIVVDELDRCLPEYAIKVMERLHHLTEGVDNIITVLAVDKEQLAKSIRQIFDFENPDKYLEKFIQFNIQLDLGTVSDRVTEKFADYIGMFDKELYPCKDSIEEYIQALFKGINVREQEHLIHKATLAHKLLYSDTKDYVFMAMELLLTVMISHYSDESCFDGNSVMFLRGENLFKDVFSMAAKSFSKPAFAEWFSEKVDYLRYRIYESWPKEYQCVLNPKAELYGAILFVWCWLHNTKNDVRIVYDGNDHINSALTNHAELLKPFAETIHLMK